MKTLIITVGLPRSGKSSWAHKQFFPVVNRDAIRLAITGQAYEPRAEMMVTAIEDYMVRSLLIAGHKTVVIDATHTTEKRRARWMDALLPPCNLYLKRIDASPEECKERAILDNRMDLIEVIDRMAASFEVESSIPDYTGPETHCGHHCHHDDRYGFVPEAGCPIHDKE